jgi:2-dehydro-3-deoxyphosphooctonate aldolase (KDO 8-P synthase)
LKADKMEPVVISSGNDFGSFTIGPGYPLVLIAGPCVLESAALARQVAEELKAITSRLGIPLIFKSSFDKANRTALQSFRGPGLDEGLAILAELRHEFSLPVISDVHETGQVDRAATVLDIIQIPALLSRQTDLLTAAAHTGKPVNLKKGQFLSPWDMGHAVEKIRTAGGRQILLTERGVTMGYNNLVVDMRSLPVMRSHGCPVIYDATHSVQLPGGAGASSSGQREFISTLARAAVGAGIDGIFMEVHPDPDRAKCDGPNSLPLHQLESLLQILVDIHAVASAADGFSRHKSGFGSQGSRAGAKTEGVRRREN